MLLLNNSVIKYSFNLYFPNKISIIYYCNKNYFKGICIYNMCVYINKSKQPLRRYGKERKLVKFGILTSEL